MNVIGGPNETPHHIYPHDHMMPLHDHLSCFSHHSATGPGTSFPAMMGAKKEDWNYENRGFEENITGFDEFIYQQATGNFGHHPKGLAIVLGYSCKPNTTRVL